MQIISRRRTALCASTLSVIAFTGIGTRAAARAATPGPAAAATAYVAPDVLEAVSLRPTDVVLAVDSAAAIGAMRETTKTFTRANRQAAANAAATAFAASKRAVLHGRAGVATVRDYAQLPVELVRVQSPAVLDALSRAAGVVSISLPQRRRLTASANLELISQPAAVAIGGTGAGTRVAVLD
ncbi:MAG: hypothetical protein QOG49_1408, partial [Frankiaceae bacterium]|nr:hypothetical protein [Frankiaceae bacterium]